MISLLVTDSFITFIYQFVLFAFAVQNKTNFYLMGLSGVFSTFSTLSITLAFLCFQYYEVNGDLQFWFAAKMKICTWVMIFCSEESLHRAEEFKRFGAAMFTSVERVRHWCRGCILVCGGLVSNAQLWSTCALFLKLRSCSGKWMGLEQSCFSPAPRGTSWKHLARMLRNVSLWRVFMHIPCSQVCHIIRFIHFKIHLFLTFTPLNCMNTKYIKIGNNLGTFNNLCSGNRVWRN